MPSERRRDAWYGCYTSSLRALLVPAVPAHLASLACLDRVAPGCVGTRPQSLPEASPSSTPRRQPMTCPPLVTALVLASVAGSTVLAVVLAPPTLWLAPDLQPLALALSAAWAAWRLMALDRALAHRRSWHQAPGWALAPEALASATTPLWWPAWLRRWGAGVGGIAGSCWGAPFAGRPGTPRC
jgi:hypothetical protein